MNIDELLEAVDLAGRALERADAALTVAIRAAHAAGASYAECGAMAGMSRQAAWSRATK